MTDPLEVGLQGTGAGAATATNTNITDILSILSTHTSIPGRISGNSVFLDLYFGAKMAELQGTYKIVQI